jgi:hypothetical protein
MLNDHDSSHIRMLLTESAIQQARPFILLAAHCKISIDGNQWCILYGENLQDGVAGFGDSPDAASYDFDRAWSTRLALHTGAQNDN